MGLHMRAAAMDFGTARLLGVRADRVIGRGAARGLLAATVAVMLTVPTPLVTPDFALQDTILVLAGVVLGGIDRLVSATLGGFASASPPASWAMRSRPTEPVPAVVLFAAVILVLLIRPEGLFTRAPSGGGAGLRTRCARRELLGPRMLVALARHLGSYVSPSTETYFLGALVNVAIVVALYVFVGNSGVVSFGHISFVAVGAWTAGVLSIAQDEKPAIMPNLACSSGIRRSGTSLRWRLRPRSGERSRSSSDCP